MQSKYQRWHDQIINRARGRKLDCYKERHHIVPKSCGGGDDPANLVDLTYREHFLIHWLLTKIYYRKNRSKLIFALHAMTITTPGRPKSSWRFDVAKRAMKEQAIAGLELRRRRTKAVRTRKSLEGYFAKFKGWKEAGYTLTFPNLKNGDQLGEEYYATLERMLSVPQA